MKLNNILLAAALASAAVGAQAGTLSVALNQTGTGFWSANFDSDYLAGSLLGGAPNESGTDTITFQDFLAPLAQGLYEVELNFMELTNGSTTTDPIHVTSATLNGLPVAYLAKRSFDIAGNTHAPFVLSLTGFSTAPDVGYHGSITVTAVPEPETYALLLAGLGLMGVMAKRGRTRQA